MRVAAMVLPWKIHPQPKRNTYSLPILRLCFTDRSYSHMLTMFLTFCDMSNSVLLPLMYSTPIAYGGLGLQPIHIGIAQGTFGFCNAIFQVQIFATVVKKFGSLRIYQFASFAFCLVFLMYPILKFFANRAGGVDTYVIIFMVLQFCMISMVYMSYSMFICYMPR